MTHMLLPYVCTIVGFVREQYGFSDEDPAERARVKFVSEELNKRT